jgi:hypothetical protein
VINVKLNRVGGGGLGRVCSHRDTRFAGSNPTEIGKCFRT